ncbi:MAG: AgmX/PglI C-terminal domain-containing protein [Proteobacteria bacterium]|nr:AgmX/PglI C-terminal domain-containing protein [Pseudomonadota bacterium]
MPSRKNKLDQAADALQRLGDSSRSTSDLGVQPGAPPVLEVVELWGDAVLEVRHFDRSTAAVKLGEPKPRGVRPWSTALVVALLVGVGALVVRHTTLPEPPRLLEGDQELIDGWSAADEAERAAIAQVARDKAAKEKADLEAGIEPPAPEPDPLDELGDPLAEARTAYDTAEAERMEQAVTDGADPFVLRATAQPFDVTALEEPEAFVVEQMMLVARQLAPAGRLSRAWAAVLEDFEFTEEALSIEAAQLLYADAVVSNSITQRCRAVDRLVTAGSDSFEHSSRQALCLRRRGLLDEAAPFAAAALGKAPKRPADRAQAEDLAGLYRLTAELAARDPALRAQEEAAWMALREFVIDELKDGGLLAVADAGVHRIRSDELAAKQDSLVRAAMALSFFVALLLPIGLIVDERKDRRGGPDFDAPETSLPVHPFPLVERDGDDVLVALPLHGTACLTENGEPIYAPELAARPRTEDVGGWLRTPLPERSQYFVELGNRVFAIRETERAAALPPSSVDDYDWRFAGILAAVLLMGASVAILGTLIDLPPGTEVLTNQVSQTVMLQPQIQELPEASGSDPGERAEGDEGASGDPTSNVKSPRAQIAQRKSDRDRAMVNDLLESMIGDTQTVGGDPNGLDTAMAGLNLTHIPGYGPGAGRWRGGPGGGGDRKGPSGISIDGAGTGGPGGPGRGPWTSVPKKKDRHPRVTTSEPITLSPFDKSAIDRVVKTHLSAIRYCYQQELTKNPALSGKVVIKFVIARDGTVSQATVKSSSLQNVITEKCITGKFMQMRFPRPKSDGIAVVAYPFVFDSAG